MKCHLTVLCLIAWNCLVGASASQAEEPEKAAGQKTIAEMEQIADLALIPPTLNTSPLPEYDYDRLDYGMTIGIERTPGGRLWACWVAGGPLTGRFCWPGSPRRTYSQASCSVPAPN